MAQPLHTSDSEMETEKKPAKEDTPVVSTAEPDDYDLERQRSSLTRITEIAEAHDIQALVRPLRFLCHCERWLYEKAGVEKRGIYRIPEEEKTPPSIWNSLLIWFSLTCHVGILPIGMLGPQYGLSLSSSAGACVIGVVLGSLCSAFGATLGPVTGLRAVATARYSFGYWGGKLCSIHVIIVGGGFAVVNFVTTGQMLSAVSNYDISIAVGIVVVAIVSYIVSFFGFQVIHMFEKYFWMGNFVLFCVLLAQCAPYVRASAPGSATGLTHAGAWLRFVALNYSSAAGWVSIAADYYCNYRMTTERWKVFLLTFLGIALPTIFTTIVGVCIGNAVLLAKYPPYVQAYEQHELGGLVREVYHPAGWSKFCLVVLTFSIMGNNVAVIYSSGLSLQFLCHYFRAIPRLLWSFLFALVITLLSIAGKRHLATIVSNFVSLLGYWISSYTFILLIEDQWFRKGHPEHGYDLENWNNPKKLPLGVAAVSSLVIGYCAGGVPGMAQYFYTGPIAAKFGGYGGDVGIYLSAAMTVVIFPPLRYFERKYSGR